MLTSHIRLGVTGLARSGKTVFITALIHNLLQGGRLPFLDVAAQGRLKSAYLVPQPDDDIPRFSYEKHVGSITGSDRIWPESTNRISQLRLALEFETTDFIWRQFGTSKVLVDIIDYPGEWLLDLPLMEMSYAEWCSEALELASMPERQTLSKDWLDFIKATDPSASPDEGLGEKASDLFKSYLKACRSKDHALSTVPPGRFLMPGDLEGSPALTFSPLILPDGRTEGDTLGAMMEKRFEAYKSRVVSPFFYNHFSRLDRQIILVDALHVINAGAEAIEDMRRALQQILRCFNTGRNSWLNYIWNKKIDRIVFAATKADQLHHTSHDRLERIMKMLTEDAVDRAEFKGADVKAVAMSSIRSTREAEISQNGEALPCILGIPLKGANMNGQVFDGNKEIAIFPGDLPAEPTELIDQNSKSEYGSGFLQFLDFRPPVLTETKSTGGVTMPHIRFDRALEFLIGDKLR
ncbi:MAG: YcjX family protein [Methyloligellaceae bacterium]